MTRNHSLRKQRREAARAERRLAAQRAAEAARGVLRHMPEGTGWLGAGDVRWEPVRGPERRGQAAGG